MVFFIKKKKLFAIADNNNLFVATKLTVIVFQILARNWKKNYSKRFDMTSHTLQSQIENEKTTN